MLQSKRGAKPIFSDSEVITLLLMDFLPFPGECQFLEFIRAHYLFPRLLDQSQFHRRWGRQAEQAPQRFCRFGVLRGLRQPESAVFRL